MTYTDNNDNNLNTGTIEWCSILNYLQGQGQRKHLEYRILIHRCRHIVQKGIPKRILQRKFVIFLSFSTCHLDVHVLFAEEVKEARHHLDVLDLNHNVSGSLPSRVHHTWVGSSGHQVGDRLGEQHELNWEFVRPDRWGRDAACGTCRAPGAAGSFQRVGPGCLGRPQTGSRAPSLQSGFPLQQQEVGCACSCSWCSGRTETVPG